MKKIFILTIAICAVFLFNTCALEIANVLGPDGGWVYYDKKSYTLGWRYIMCSPNDYGELRGDWTNVNKKEEIVRAALKRCDDNSADWHKFGWELPTEADLRKMLECFSYGLTRFKDDYYYISVDKLYAAGSYWTCQTPQSGQNHKTGDGVINTDNFCTQCGKAAPTSGWIPEPNAPPDPARLEKPADWEVKIFRKKFSTSNPNGKIEEITDPSALGDNPIRVRAIRRF